MKRKNVIAPNIFLMNQIASRNDTYSIANRMVRSIPVWYCEILSRSEIIASASVLTSP
jgi:hypothetical protein